MKNGLERVFDLLAEDLTLLQALDGGDGPDLAGAQRILVRPAVAALLNATHLGVGYPLTEGEVLEMVREAVGTENRHSILALSLLLDMYNNLGCPL